MDKDTRNALQRATQSARKLLEKEFGELLEGTYDILPDGTILSEPGAHLDERQRLARRKMVSTIGHKRAGNVSPQDAVADAIREAAFTTLNRFAALKMLEARKLIQPCISAGDQSSGFKEFTGLAPGLAALPDKGYRLYLECLFDEIGCEVKVLFDRRDVASILWPRRQALFDLIDILNDAALVSVWEADETIGWIYQYFNGEDERRAMREASQAPQNSHELAVRNQFFTPRYVVEFLTDNTLGRIWYEMMQGKTKIVDHCAYLVRRPKEIFLKEGEDPPAQDHPAEISQSELLKLPVYTSFRKRKDPRDIRLLDPAGGSGHFLLYGFDLFLFIYEESWHDEEAPASEITGQSLRMDFPAIEDLRLAIPGLILRHNLHGIDIDPRAAQIASLALWMRAQRAYSDYDIPRDIRPAIRKTNFVVAEPMPGEHELLKEFIDDLSFKHPRVLGNLVRIVFEKMELAGEAGSLLKIEEEIHDTIAEAKEIWQREYMSAVDKHGRPMLFSERELGRTTPMQSGLFDVSDTDEQFWDKAENLLIDALHDYAKRAANGKGYQRRLFVEDAEQGFAFIDLCRKRYDVVLMNPPFGESAPKTDQYLRKAYPLGYIDLYTAFLDRACQIAPQGFTGAITSRTALTLSSFSHWRKTRLLGETTIRVCADLGYGVLDSAMVETACYTLSGVCDCPIMTFIDLDKIAQKDAELLVAVKHDTARVFYVRPSDLLAIPNAAMAYFLESSVRNDFRRLPPVSNIAEVLGGNATSDDARFIRCFWEVPARTMLSGADRRWRWISKGGEYSVFYTSIHLVLDWRDDGGYLGEHMYTSRPRNGYLWGPKSWSSAHMGLPGVVWSLRSQAGISFRALPRDCVMSGKSAIVTTRNKNLDLALLAILNTERIADLARCLSTFGSYEKGAIASLPVDLTQAHDFPQISRKAFHAARTLHSYSEADPHFSPIIKQTRHSLAHLTQCIKSDISEQSAVLSTVLSEANKKYLSDSPGVPHGREMRIWEAAESISGAEVISEFVGIIFGRWDVRIAMDPPLAPKLPAPFDPLPVCSPGMLVGPDGLPAEPGRIVSEEWLRARPDANTLPLEGVVKRATIPDSEYPPAICWNGILVDDPGHPDDILTRIRQIFDVIWQDKAHEIYEEATEILDPSKNDLRPWFRDNFFADHIKRYSKSRRKAPIYWCLSTPSQSYAVWLYYHRFNRDTLYKVLNDCVKPKLQLEERKLTTLRVEIGDSPTSAQRRLLADQEKFVTELKTLHEAVALTAPLWKPDLNDGVIINFALLWRLVPQPSTLQKECKQTWDALIRGDYDWAHLAMHLWPERVVPKCYKDRSLAIAHGLEESLWEQDEDGKWKPRDLSRTELNDLIAARSSRSVKDALEKLLAAPATAGNGVRRRRS